MAHDHSHDHDDDEDGLKETVLNGLHRSLGAKMVPFAGYEMPVQYGLGVMKEHLHTRAAAGLFDVSHMGQVVLRGPGLDEALEKIVPVDIANLPEDRQKYGYLTNADGGIVDDLMIARREDHLFVVVNAACKDTDLTLMRAALEPEGIRVKLLENRALIALQGPAAEDVLAEHHPAVRDMKFMDVATLPLGGAECWVSRSGYTGEDGFEISLPNQSAEAFVKALLQDPRVEPIGLGARDSLRLEAGLCLYGQDIDETTTPVEAGLTWAMGKRRKTEGGFEGADYILGQLADGVKRKRVGLRPEGRAPMRSGVPLFDAETGGTQIGEVTSGGFGPTVGGPVAMGYVATDFAGEGTRLWGEVRGKRMAVDVAALPFVPAGFKR
ncbi:glycine cleavage system protein T [Sagittula sp. P11]|jgi:aminomethyltransferase|uniref:glycine cleavage system aminomethyltransferase GcvT n=1 Tax=Sagittula sp. P11 TaxID=2009329 RepID=UPI000C2CF5BB|nr:glycine cleavage system aminomethyltransferase GcvT [Sagittula sp. P11]AUC53416.1 glycine cleavage system protein T [Sagittula sp. P11]